MQFSPNIISASLPTLNCGHKHITKTRYNVCACYGDRQGSASVTSHSHHNPPQVSNFFPNHYSSKTIHLPV